MEKVRERHGTEDGQAQYDPAEPEREGGAGAVQILSESGMRGGQDLLQ